MTHLAAPAFMLCSYPMVLPNGPSPYVHLTEQSNELSVQYLRDPNDEVIKAEKVTLVIDYPVRKKKRVALEAANKTAFTRAELARKIAEAYQKMYDEEAATTALPVETMAQRSGGDCMLLNRAETDGIWGIWGHVLDDLAMHTIYYDAKNKTIRVGVDS